MRRYVSKWFPLSIIRAALLLRTHVAHAAAVKLLDVPSGADGYAGDRILSHENIDPDLFLHSPFP